MKVLMVDQIAKVNYKYTYSLANAVRNQGFEITLAIDQKEESANCSCPRRKLFNTDEKNIGKISKLLNYLKSYHTILKLARYGDVNILHTQWLIFSPVDYYFLREIKKIRKKDGIRLIVTVHDILPFDQKFYDMYYHRKVYALADRIIVQADNNIQRFYELFPELSEKVVMIPHGHFLDHGEPVDQGVAREYLGIGREKVVLLFFGQIKKVKGVGIMLQAFAQIHKNYPDLLLVIAGSVWKDEFSQYQEIIDENKLHDVVRTDIRYIPDDEVKYFYSAADCCLLPYLDVYQSGVIQLTYAYKKPVVATDIGAFREVVLDGETGFLCEPDNVDDLAAAMEKALQSKEKFGEMGQRGFDYIRDKFSWEKIAESVGTLYTQKL